MAQLLDEIAMKFYGVRRQNPMQGMFGDIFKVSCHPFVRLHSYLCPIHSANLFAYYEENLHLPFTSMKDNNAELLMSRLGKHRPCHSIQVGMGSDVKGSCYRSL